MAKIATAHRTTILKHTCTCHWLSSICQNLLKPPQIKISGRRHEHHQDGILVTFVFSSCLIRIIEQLWVESFCSILRGFWMVHLPLFITTLFRGKLKFFFNVISYSSLMSASVAKGGILFQLSKKKAICQWWHINRFNDYRAPSSV